MYSSNYLLTDGEKGAPPVNFAKPDDTKYIHPNKEEMLLLKAYLKSSLNNDTKNFFITRLEDNHLHAEVRKGYFQCARDEISSLHTSCLLISKDGIH